MKNHSFLLGFSLLFMTQICFAQKNIFKAGPSLLVNVDGFHEQVSLPLGLEVAYEFGILEKASLNVAASFHYGKHKSGWEENRILGNKQEDFISALQVDFRYHFKERYGGTYVGFGLDVKWLEARYFFVPTATDPVPTLADYERNIGIAYGTYVPLKKGAINPHIYLGFDPSGINTYPVHLKGGLNFVF